MATTGDRLTTQEPNVTVQKGTKVLTPPARSRPTTPAEQEVDTVQVWPHLVVIEFLGAVVITINLVLLSTLFNGPLLGLANPDQTPNPSKAPWYFLNLQELLLHMNPALAGVIVPTVALGLLAIIPYVDRGSRGLGVWWYSDRGKKVALFTTVYTIAVTAALIALDNFGKLKARFDEWLSVSEPATGTQAGPLSFMTEALGGMLGGTATATAEAQGILIETIVNWLIPTFFLLFFPVLLVFMLKRVYKGIDLSEIIIALFTGFVVVYFVLTFVGTAMRGPGMELFPPWALPATHE
ncbi:MAG: menaquinol-cytochrome C reductase [Chloroflexia bacterium]